MTRAASQEPSDLVLSSTTENQEQLDHAVSEEWKQPFVPKAEQEAAEKKQAIEEEVKAKLAETEVGEKEEVEPEAAHADEAEEEVEEDKPAGKRGWSKRVNKLTARNARIAEELRVERERAASLESRLAALERGEKPEARSELTVSDLPNKPKRIDFTDEEKYVESLIKWTRANEDHKENAQAEQDRLKEVFANHVTRLNVARETYEDWDAVAKAAESMTLQPSVDLAIREMDNSADVLYFLATHPAEYEKMSALSPLRQVGEATRISDRIATRGANGNAAPRRTRTAPPEPITPGGKRPTKSSVKLDDMGTEDYLRARRQMRAQRRAN